MDVVQASSSSALADEVDMKLSTLLDVFPQAPYEFLRSKALELAGQNQDAFARFIEELLTAENYPKTTGSSSSSSSAFASKSSSDPYANPVPSTSKEDVTQQSMTNGRSLAEETGFEEIFAIDQFMDCYDQDPFSYFERMARDEQHGNCVAAYLKDNLENSLELFELNLPFDIIRFMERYNQDPFKYFDELERDVQHGKCVAAYLKDKFRMIKTNYIETEVVLNGLNLTKAADSLSCNPCPNQLLEKPRTSCEMDLLTTKPISFLKEVQFYEHRQDILDYKETKSLSRQIAMEEGEFMTCECCSDDEILFKDIMTCPEGHTFCRNCIKRYAEVRMGDGETDVPCLQGCPAPIPLKCIEQVLPREMFNKLTARIQEKEVKQAAISGIESCCACEYAVIPAPGDLVIKCIKCGVETCRACKNRTHVPFKCGETAKDDQLKQTRKKSEETQTMKIVRKCTKCQRSIVKNGGCDLITCQCSSTICNRCGTGGVDYNHFAVCPANPSSSPWS